MATRVPTPPGLNITSERFSRQVHDTVYYTPIILPEPKRFSAWDWVLVAFAAFMCALAAAAVWFWKEVA